MLVYQEAVFITLTQKDLEEIDKLTHKETFKINTIIRIQSENHSLFRNMKYVCRHTFCSNMAKSGMNPKMLQYIMGHSDISVTMNTYTHVKFQDAQEDFQKAINS